MAAYRGWVAAGCVLTRVRGVALPPAGVKVTDETVCVTEPQFHETPTSIRRLAPVPVVWATPALLAAAAPVPLETAPSSVTTGAKFAVTALSASMVTAQG